MSPPQPPLSPPTSLWDVGVFIFFFFYIFFFFPGRNRCAIRGAWGRWRMHAGYSVANGCFSSAGWRTPTYCCFACSAGFSADMQSNGCQTRHPSHPLTRRSNPPPHYQAPRLPVRPPTPASRLLCVRLSVHLPAVHPDILTLPKSFMEEREEENDRISLPHSGVAPCFVPVTFSEGTAGCRWD